VASLSERGNHGHNPQASGKQLVSPVAIDACRTLGSFVRPSQLTDRDPIDIKLLMPAWHRFCDYDNDNDFGRCSTGF
jgi:hypothetical protein